MSSKYDATVKDCRVIIEALPDGRSYRLCGKQVVKPSHVTQGYAFSTLEFYCEEHDAVFQADYAASAAKSQETTRAAKGLLLFLVILFGAISLAVIASAFIFLRAAP